MVFSTQQEAGKVSLGLPVRSATTAAHKEGELWKQRFGAVGAAENPSHFLQFLMFPRLIPHLFPSFPDKLQCNCLHSGRLPLEA